MRSRLLAGISALALLAVACSQDTAGPDKNTAPKPIFPVSVGDPALKDLIEQQLTCLYQQGLLPNEQSSLGKFRHIQTLVAANDLDSASTATNNLVDFIELKYSQYTGPATINCNPPIPGYTNPVSIAQLKDDVITNLWSYVGLTGEICEVPAGEPKLCKTEDQTSGFVYFPDNIFNQITFVGLEQNPPGLNALQNLFDEYPNRVRIVVNGLNDFSDDNLFPIKPIVVVCFNDAVVPSDQSVLSRLLLGANHNGNFQFLPAADFSSYPPEVLQEAQNMCGPPPSPSAFFSPASTLGRLGNSFLDLLLPKPLQASSMRELAFGGAGGATEQFSDFGVVDPGMNAFGGAGGATEQFAPPAAVAGTGTRANATTSGSTVTGTAGETESDAADLPSVRVVSPVGLVGIPGVHVTFTLLDPITLPYSSAPSLATLCGATTVDTDANGVATLPCLNFGTKAGYKNLRITFDPTGVDPLACIIGGTGACDNSTDVNFLVQTNAGAAALIKPYMPPDTTNQVFSYGINLTPYLPVSPAPRARVTDQYGNVVGSNVSVYWFANTTTGAVLDPATPATLLTGANGTSQVTSWTLGEGVNELFASLFSDLSQDPLPAKFTASTPTGIPIFTCGIGSSKVDLGPFTIPAPNAILRDITLQMSVTGQSSAISNYQASLSVRLDGFNGTQVGVGGGTIALPGNNGSPTSVTFHLTTPVPRQTGSHTLWFRLNVTVPPTRKIQLWYNSSFQNNSPCKDAKIYSPTYPSPSGVVKAGLSIVATN